MSENKLFVIVTAIVIHVVGLAWNVETALLG